jgi:hypothetical protein
LWASGQLSHDTTNATDQATSADSEVDEALALFGLVREDAGEPLAAAAAEFYLWPEHEQTYVLWLSVQTQWQHGWHGRTGLAYAGVRAAPGFVAIKGRRKREQCFAELCLMERAALDVWNERRG